MYFHEALNAHSLKTQELLSLCCASPRQQEETIIYQHSWIGSWHLHYLEPRQAQ